MIEVNAVVYSFFGLSILHCATSSKPGCGPMCIPQLMHRAGLRSVIFIGDQAAICLP